MSDGRLLVAGGNLGADTGQPIANIFDPSTETWTVLPDMSYARWYPQANILPNGNIIVTSGETNCAGCDVTVQEIYNPSTNSWSQLSSAPFFFPYYPRVFVLPDGRLLVAGTSENSIVSEALDLNTLTWTSIGGPAVDGGSAVMYLPNEILKMGTSADPTTDNFPSAATAYVLDMTQATPAWTPVASMAFPRTYHNSTLLPDGTVLVTGGGLNTEPTDTFHAVLPVELWSPVTQTWTTLASMNAPRLYHAPHCSARRARPDLGRRASVQCGECTDQLSAEFFEPPYLFQGPRPTITAAPAQLSYGQNFTVQTPDAGQIATVSLIRFGAVTHAFNVGQRFLPLSFTAGSGSLTVTAPANSNLAPPGNYMLFIVSTSGVPSVAAIVNFGPTPGSVPPRPVPPGPVPKRFTGGGYSDLLWQYTPTGDYYIWLMQGTVHVSNIYLGRVPAPWSLAGAGDFKGDGKSGLFWENTMTGQRAIWFLNNGTFVSSIFLPTVSTDWHIAGAGDFNGDGQADWFGRIQLPASVQFGFSTTAPLPRASFFRPSRLIGTSRA